MKGRVYLVPMFFCFGLIILSLVGCVHSDRYSDRNRGDILFEKHGDVFYASFEGVLPNGLGYRFHGEDRITFCFDEFRIRHSLFWERSIEAHAIVRVPSEAAEVWVSNFFGNTPDAGVHMIDIYYCSESSSWVMELTLANPSHADIAWMSIFGPIKVISIDYHTGVITEHVGSRSVTIDEEVWPRSFFPPEGGLQK